MAANDSAQKLLFAMPVSHSGPWGCQMARRIRRACLVVMLLVAGTRPSAAAVPCDTIPHWRHALWPQALLEAGYFELEKNDVEAALQSFRAAASAAHERDETISLEARVALSTAFHGLGMRDSAQSNALIALVGGTARHDSGLIAEASMAMGAIADSDRMPQVALGWYERALTAFRACAEDTYLIGPLLRIGTIAEERGDSRTAIDCFESCLRIARRGRALEVECVAHRRIAAVHQYLTGDIAAAAAHYDSADASCSREAPRRWSDADRRRFREEIVPLYEDWALLFLRPSGRAQSQDRDTVLAALGAIDLGRVRSLLAALSGATPEAMLADSGWYSSEWEAAPREKRLDLTALARAAVKRVLFATDLLLYYWCMDDRLVVWSCSDTTCRVVVSAVGRGDLSRLIRAVRTTWGVDSAVACRGAPGGGGGTIIPSAEELLSQYLFPDGVAGDVAKARRLVVVSQGPLELLPLEALRVKGQDERLGATTSVRYLPGLFVGSESCKRCSPHVPVRKSELFTRSALVVGYGASLELRDCSGRIRFQSLPGVEGEAQFVADLCQTRPLIGKKASKDKVRQLWENASLIHIAAHAYAHSDEKNAEESFLALAPGESRDSLLTASELLLAWPSTRADLVVLSACQTGLGRVSQTESVVGIERALLLKGARAVVVTLWSVEDSAATAFVKAFYRELRATDGPVDYAMAIKTASMELEQASEGKPSRWAAFRLVTLP